MHYVCAEQHDNKKSPKTNYIQTFPFKKKKQVAGRQYNF